VTGERVVRDFLQHVWNERQVERFSEFVSEEVIFHPPRGATHDFGTYQTMARTFMAAFPDLRFEITQALAYRDLVALQLVITGTNTGPFRGRPATARTVRVEGRPWVRVKDWRIVEFWQSFDELGLLYQLGHFTDEPLLGARFSP
jgi:predicted ester cyclase